MSKIEWANMRLPKETLNRLKNTNSNDISIYHKLELLLDLEDELKNDMEF